MNKVKNTHVRDQNTNLWRVKDSKIKSIEISNTHFQACIGSTMTDKKVTGDLNDFFKKNSKKAPPKKKTTQETTEDVPSKVQAEETKVEVQKVAKHDYESSEEEKTDLTLGEDQAQIKDRKEVEAERRKKQEQESGGVGMGWHALDTQAKEEPKLSSAPKQKGGDIKFGGKPDFKRKVGLVGGKNDFPELGSET